MVDIVPKLLESILQDFDSMIKADDRIQSIINGQDDTSTLADVSIIANEVGQYAALCLEENYRKIELPDGILYWNIAKRTIMPLMRQVHNTVLDMLDAVQIREDKKAKIGIKPIRPKFNEERVEAVINKVVFVAQLPEVPHE